MVWKVVLQDPKYVNQSWITCRCSRYDFKFSSFLNWLHVFLTLVLGMDFFLLDARSYDLSPMKFQVHIVTFWMPVLLQSILQAHNEVSIQIGEKKCSSLVQTMFKFHSNRTCNINLIIYRSAQVENAWAFFSRNTPLIKAHQDASWLWKAIG